MRKLVNLQEDQKHPTTTYQKQETTSGIHTESRFGRDLCKFDHFYHKLHSSRPVQLRAETSENPLKKEAGKYFVVQRQCARNVVIIVFVAILRGINCC
jgi:hypothetical protein